MGLVSLLGKLADALISNKGRADDRKVRKISSGRGARPHSSGTEQAPDFLAAAPGPEDEIAQAEAETRRMLEEAYAEMIDDRIRVHTGRIEHQLGQAAGKVIDLETNVGSRVDSMIRSLDEIQARASTLEKLERKVNLLLGVVFLILAVCLYLLYRTL